MTPIKHIHVVLKPLNAFAKVLSITYYSNVNQPQGLLTRVFTLIMFMIFNAHFQACLTYGYKIISNTYTTISLTTPHVREGCRPCCFLYMF
jgi:hypothetical protein